MRTAKVPATVITGFLGAGKTTLIRHLIENADGRRIALIVNEFGDIGVDGELLRSCGVPGCTDDDIVELTNGCICCTVADDFVPTMTALLERKERPDHIVIETSGLALPQPLVQAFNWPGIAERVTCDGVVTVVDAAALADGRFAHDHGRLEEQRNLDDALDHETPIEELFEDQLRAADLVVLNKTDLIDAEATNGLRKTIDHAAGRAVRAVSSAMGRLPVEVVLGIGAATETLIGQRRSHHEIEHEAGEEHDHDEFASFVVEGAEVDDLESFIEALKPVLARHDILRLKGFVDVRGKPMRGIVQAVGTRVEHGFDRPWQPDERSTRLVVIGLHDLNEAAVRGDLAALLDVLPQEERAA